MTTAHPKPILATRRALLGGAGSLTLVALAGCAMQPGYFDVVEAVRRLMQASADRAFARLLAPGGFYDDALVRLSIPERLGGREGRIADRLLRSGAMRDRLARSFNDMAGRAAARAAPAVTDAIHRIGIRDALALVRGSPTAATDALHAEMGTYLVGLLVPEFGQLLRVADDPLLSELALAVTGVDAGGIAQDLARQADTAIWREIGRSEADIRANPEASGDPVLRRLFGRP